MKQKHYVPALLSLVATLALALTGCQRDEVSDLQRSIDDLKKSQEAQGELIQALQVVQELKENDTKAWNIQKSQKGLPVTVATLTDGRLLAVSEGGLTLFEKSEDGKVLINNEKTDREWTTPMTIEICPKGVWLINGESTRHAIPTLAKKQKPYTIQAKGTGYLITLANGKTYTLAKSVGLFYLAEGSFGKGNGELEFFSLDANTEKYSPVDGLRWQKFGETPNAFIPYGSKIYVAVSGKQGAKNGSVRVLDRTGRLLKEIKLAADGGDLMPRQLVAHEGKVYVSAYLDPADKDYSFVARLDTIEYKPEYAKITGKHSEGLTTEGNELFICQSGQGRDNKIAVVDLATFKEKEVITVGYNPCSIVGDGKGNLYFGTKDVYDTTTWTVSTPSDLHKMTAADRKVVKTYNIRTGSLAIHNGILYITNISSWTTGACEIKKLNTTDDTVSDFSKKLPHAMFASKVAAFDDERGELYITQSLGSTIFRFKYDGTLVEKLRAKQQNGAGVLLIK